MPRKDDPQKTCACCGATMARKMFNGRLEDRGVFLRRRFCNLTCFGQSKMVEVPAGKGIYRRSRRLRGSACETCGTSNALNVHHIDGNPTNNHASNLMTLCAPCHTRWHWRHGKRKPRRLQAQDR